jgi:Xaa-Pro dipeptidase
MCTDRRDFLRSTAGVVGATLMGSRFAFADTADVETIQERQEVPELIRRLPKMTAGIVPITDDERWARIGKAQSLMSDQKIDAIYIEPGSTMFYYTGMRWNTSERMLALIIPQRGELAWVCPKFEEERARELIKFGKDIRTWEEDESPIVASRKSFAIADCARAASESKSGSASFCSMEFDRQRRDWNSSAPPRHCRLRMFKSRRKSL